MDALIPPSEPDPLLYTRMGMVELVRLARERATSFDGGMTVLNAGLHLGLLLTGDIISILLGFRPVKLMR